MNLNLDQHRPDQRRPLDALPWRRTIDSQSHSIGFSNDKLVIQSLEALPPWLRKAESQHSQQDGHSDSMFLPALETLV